MNILNTTLKVKNVLGEGLVLAKEKLLEEELRDKIQGQELQLKVLKVDKCHFIEDFQKEDLIQLIRIK